MPILVTPRENPDLDGTACTFAYAEFLNKTGIEAVGAIFGTPHKEVLFVLNKFNISHPKNADEIISKTEKIIIVDDSDITKLPKKIDPTKVIEMIDHRQVGDRSGFANAKFQIELVGSAATLIAEKFYQNKIEITPESSALLFSAIISNTVNFKAGVTTERDKKMAEWLETKFTVPNNFIHEMFADKSKFDGTVEDVIINDFATFNFSGKIIGVGQLEIIEVNLFIEKNLSEIKAVLQKLKQQKNLDFSFIKLIDVEIGFNKFIVIDNETQKLLEQTLKIEFQNSIAEKDGVMMRKEVMPLIKEILEK